MCKWQINLQTASNAYISTSYVKPLCAPFLWALVLCTLLSCAKEEPGSAPEKSPLTQEAPLPNTVEPNTFESNSSKPNTLKPNTLKPSTFKPKLNDTGITWGGDYPKGINEDCSAKINNEILPDGEAVSGDILSAQDCRTGKDANANSKTKSNNKQPAFQYEKIDFQGALLVNDAPMWQCVLDKTTGLMWEVKQEGDGKFANRGLHDADDIFMWYSGNAKNNGGSVGKWNADFAHCTGYVKDQPATYCNTSEFIQRINQQKLCGYDDWRLPSLAELNGLIHYGRTKPAINIQFFPNTQDQYYWSSTPSAGNDDLAWAVSFQFGNTSPLRRDNARHIRVVRSAYAIQ